MILINTQMFAFTPSCLYVAASVFVYDVKQGIDVEHAKETLRFVLQVTNLFARFYRSGQMFLAQLLLVLKQSNIDLEMPTLEGNPTAAGPQMNCDFEYLGPLWSTEAHLNGNRSSFE